MFKQLHTVYKQITQHHPVQHRVLHRVVYGVMLGVCLFFISFGSVDASILTKPPNNLGLVGYWNFNEGVGTQAGDSSANSNTGTLTNMANPPTASSGWGNGKFDKGLNFDGVDDYVDVGDIAAVDTATALTVCAWVKHDTLTADHAIVTKGDSAGNNGFQLFRDDVGFDSGRTDMYNFYVADSADTDTARVEGVTGSSVADVWTHVCGTFQASNTVGLRLYKNGIEDVNSPASTASIGAINAGTNKLLIGALTDPIRLFDGSLDDVRIYNRALTATEVSAVYKSGSARFGASSATLTQGSTLKDGLVGHWTFDGKDTTNTTATDLSGQGNTGTFSGFTRSTNAVAGKLGQGLDFDGSNDYVAVSNGMLPSMNGSISVWAKTSDATNAYRSIASPGSGSSNNPLFLIQFVANSDAGCTTDHSVKFILRDNAGTAVQLCSGTANNDGQFHHYVGTSISGNNKFYVDGVLVASNSTSFGAVTFDRFGIGTIYRSTADQFFPGIIDDVRVYDRALSASEVKQLYQLSEAKFQASSATLTQGTTLTDGLVGHWTFDGKDTTNATATDLSGQGNDGTFTGFTRSTNAVAGKLGQGMSFDGVDDGVDVGDPANGSLDFGSGQDFSFCFWMKPNSAQSANYLLSKLTGSGPGWRLWFDGSGTAQSIRLVMDQDDAGGATTFDISLPNNFFDSLEFHYICGSVDRDANWELFVDGQTQGTTDISTESGSLVNTTPFFIGNLSALDSRGIDGIMDDVRIYNRALSASEVKQLYLMGK